MKSKITLFLVLLLTMAVHSQNKHDVQSDSIKQNFRLYSITEKDGYNLVEQVDGPTLGYSPNSGVRPLVVDGHVFKDLSRTGELLPYEDWRLDAEVRARDLASRLSIEQIAGLMLYSSHQAVPQMWGAEQQRAGLCRGLRNGHSGKQQQRPTQRARGQR